MRAIWVLIASATGSEFYTSHFGWAASHDMWPIIKSRTRTRKPAACQYSTRKPHARDFGKITQWPGGAIRC